MLFQELHNVRNLGLGELLIVQNCRSELPKVLQGFRENLFILRALQQT